MSEFRKTVPGEMYFITLTVVGWIDLFTRPALADIVIENLKYCQKHKALNIYAYVIMPSHLHLIAATETENVLSRIIGDFKSFTSKKIISHIKTSSQESRRDWLLYLFRYFAKNKRQYSSNHLWESTIHPVFIDSGEILAQRLDYIFNNPVKSNIVSEPEHYLYSSAHPCSPIKVLPI